MRNKNIGYFFYKEYFNGVQPVGRIEPDDNPEEMKEKKRIQENNEKIIKKGNGELLGFELGHYKALLKKLDQRIQLAANCRISASVGGRGALFGTGHPREAFVKGEYKFGFEFDHTTGLPFFHGTSLKGCLRALCPSKADDPQAEFCKAVFRHLTETDMGKGSNLRKLDPVAFTHRIFEHAPEGRRKEGERVRTHETCQFIGACLAPGNSENLFQEDYITPHKNRIQKPNPLFFVKLPAQTKMNFYFHLPKRMRIEGWEMTREDLLMLFGFFLENHGIGAKTNYDFGYFYDVKRETTLG